MNSIGFAERSSCQPRQASQKTGVRHNTNSATLTQRWRSMVPGSRSVIRSQVHAGVQAGDLVAVAVEHQRLPLAKFAQPALGLLRPTRVIDVRIHVGVEPILAGVGLVPTG